MNMTIPFWALIAIILIVGAVSCFIISLFADDTGYLPDIFNALIIMLVFFITISICIGMIAGKYLF